jgi:hypothetical protein
VCVCVCVCVCVSTWRHNTFTQLPLHIIIWKISALWLIVANTEYFCNSKQIIYILKHGNTVVCVCVTKHKGFFTYSIKHNELMLLINYMQPFSENKIRNYLNYIWILQNLRRRWLWWYHGGFVVVRKMNCTYHSLEPLT